MIRQSLVASLKALSHTRTETLILTRSVSGTAKGKAKLKAGQVLKRASLSKNKQASDESSTPRGGRVHKDAIDRLTSMANSCLSATTPIRHLSAKEREREAEREKLGLISKDRQRELDMIKAQKKAAKEGKKEEENKRVPLVILMRWPPYLVKSNSGVWSLDHNPSFTSGTHFLLQLCWSHISNSHQHAAMLQYCNPSEIKPIDNPSIIGAPGLDYISLGLVDEEAIPKYELTVEDGRRLAKEYSRVLMRQHRARQKAETDLLKLKKEAINALPEKLREAALVPDLMPFPTNRFMATLTPPIEGYAEKVKEAAMKHTVKEKLR